MPTTSEHFAAIGRVAYEWSRLELFVQTVIAVLAECPHDTGLVVTNPGSIRSWMETLRRLATHRQCPPDLYGRLKRLSKHIEDDLQRERNTVIHGLWHLSWDELF